MNTRKIGITTMTGGANFGNALQNYAVIRLIEQYGFSAETLNITTTQGYPDPLGNTASLAAKLAPSYIRRWLHGRKNAACGAKNDTDFRRSTLKALEKNADRWRVAVHEKQRKFSEFQKDSLHYTAFEVNPSHIPTDKLAVYAAFVTGSDQVWNPNYKTNSFIEFLQFAPKEKRIALSPSFGVSDIPSSRIENYTAWLQEIPYLSVREQAGADIIQKLTGRQAAVLLDPTFGLTADEWLEFAQKPADFADMPEPYVFCYFLGNRTKKYTKYIKKYAAAHHCNIIDVWDVRQLEHYSYDPREFVWLLAHAKAVFTDSFHGTAFSVNLQKPFVVFDRADDGCITQSSRITTILQLTGLQERKFETLSVSNIDNIDFTDSTTVIHDKREQLKSFLSSALLSATAAKESVHLASDRHCTGCGACSDACTRHAITLQPDAEGFCYPVIDTALCVSCGNCQAVCPADRIRPEAQTTTAYYSFSKDTDTCRSSSSGGVFSELARKTIADGGIVFGAGYNEKFEVVHLPAENEQQLANLRTSKYVQSNTHSVYLQVKEALQADRKVLFSGTPCQIAALKSFIRSENENLLTVDIICHGVPSPGIWQKYLAEKHSAKEISHISFRDKTLGWNDFSMKIDYADGSFYRELATKDPFESAFLENLTLRPSCYQCQYKTVDRVSDITIADYWGVELVHPELKEQQGVSLVLLHSEKGQAAFRDIRATITCGETDLQRSTTMNHATTHSVPWPQRRNTFFALQKDIGVAKAASICLRPTVSQKFRRFVVKNGSRVKKVLRKIRNH